MVLFKTKLWRVMAQWLLKETHDQLVVSLNPTAR